MSNNSLYAVIFVSLLVLVGFLTFFYVRHNENLQMQTAEEEFFPDSETTTIEVHTPAPTAASPTVIEKPVIVPVPTIPEVNIETNPE